jgi:uncharacterized protein (DUF433 family)
MNNFQHIISNPDILNGKPCIKGTRISVSIILELLAGGKIEEDIITKQPHLQKEWVLEAINFASKFNNNEIVLALNIA